MAKTAALGDGPIVFFSQGAHIEVPLSAIFFDGDQIDTTRADLKALPGNPFLKWITFLSKQNQLVAAAAPPAAKAALLTAADPGSAGNNIQLTVTRKTDTTVDLEAAEIDTYVDLTMAKLKERLGADGVATLGTQPGLLHVKAFPAGSEAQTVVATASITPTGGSSPKWTIAGSGATAVTLEPRNGGAEFNGGDSKTVAISNVSTDGATFTLTVTWTKKASDVAEGGLTAAFATLGFLIDATPPDGGYKLPRPGTVKLTGGSEPVEPAKARATVLATA